MTTPKFLINLLPVSIIAIILLPAYTFLYLHPSFSNMLIDSIEKEAKVVGTHLSLSTLPDNEIALIKFSKSAAFENEVNEIVKEFGIIKLKTFSSSGEIIFSTDRNEIGEINKKSYFYKKVARGNTYTQIIEKHTKTLEDKAIPLDVVETYIPIMSNDKFIGAFEIYYDITERKGMLDRLIFSSFSIVFTISLTLLIAVILSSLRAKKINFELKRAEESLMRASKLESVGRLAFGIAHEINNPLTNISLGVQILKNRTVDKEILQELESIETNIEKASIIAKELLQFSRHNETSFINVDINSIIKSTLALMDYKLQSVKVHQELSDVPYVLGDPIKLEQVFINVINNAIDAMPNGGDIYISISHKYGLIIIEISDSGIGIADEDKQKLFDPFFTTKEIGKGSGLGLSICYSIIKQHNGIIEISSINGKGTTVTIKLPIWERNE